MDVPDIEALIQLTLQDFITSLGHECQRFHKDDDLLQASGASSDEGVEFAIELSERLGFELPHDFNPFVHPTGKRGMKFKELVKSVKMYCEAQPEVSNGT